MELNGFKALKGLEKQTFDQAYITLEYLQKRKDKFSLSDLKKTYLPEKALKVNRLNFYQVRLF